MFLTSILITFVIFLIILTVFLVWSCVNSNIKIRTSLDILNPHLILCTLSHSRNKISEKCLKAEGINNWFLLMNIAAAYLIRALSLGVILCLGYTSLFADIGFI